MCIIICKPKGEQLPKKDILKNCFINNDDGAGFSFVKDNRIYISKGYDKFKPFYKDVRRRITDDSSAILHFRIASVGKVSEANCHPFIISQDKKEIDKVVNCTKKPVFAHNGTLSIRESNGKSDTRQYARVIGDPLIRNNIFRNDSLCKILESSIGTGKMAFMNRRGDIKLFGEFEKEEGLFFSNHSYNYRIGFVKTIKSTWEKRWDKKDEQHRNAYGHGSEYGINGYGDDYDGYLPTYDKMGREKRGKREELKDDDKNTIKLLNDKRAEGYPVAHTGCEICDKEDNIYYYPKIDTSLCIVCFSLYCMEDDGEVVDDNKESEAQIKQRKEE